MIDLYLKHNSEQKVQKSFNILKSNTELFLQGMLDENMGEYGETVEMKEKIEKAHNLTNEINEN